MARSDTDIDLAMEKAIKDRDVRVIRDLIARGANLENALSEILYNITEDADIEIAEELIAAGADINNDNVVDAVLDLKGVDILYFVDLWLDKGASEHTIMRFLLVPLKDGERDTVEYLLRRGQISYQGKRILLLEPNREVLQVGVYFKTLLGLISFQQDDLDQALINAISRYSNFQNIQALLQYGAHINTSNSMPLITAVETRDLQDLNYLISKGANVHAQDDKALLVAVSLNKELNIEQLMKANANIYAQNGEILKMLQQDSTLRKFIPV